MEAQIINLAKWKHEHHPAIACLNAALAMGLAWQKLWLKVIYGAYRR